MNTYQLRAECQHDLNGLATALKSSCISATIITDQAGTLSDCEAVIATDAPIETLRDVIRTVIDGHTMVQTLKPASEYDGVRNYDL